MQTPVAKSVKPSIRSIMGGIVDYAGMFPPAKLSLEDALSHYRQYTGGHFAWILNRFVCPFIALSDLQRLLAEGPPAVNIRLSLIAPVKLDDTDGVSKLLSEIRELNKAENHVLVDALEIRAGDVQNQNFTDSLQLVSRDSVGAGLIDIYVEVPWSDEASLVKAAGDVAAANINGNAFGLKIRSGGVEAHMVPPSDAVARFIMTCVSAGIKFKATAGLHHPYPNFDADVGTTMHGFVNVFFASAAAANGMIDEDGIVELLSDSSPGNFEFKSLSISWKDIELSSEQLDASRRTFATTFGSCSFDEPVHDLQQLDLLPH